MGALKHHGKSIYSGFIPNKPFISSGITDLLSVVVSTEDFTMNRPDIAPALTEITVLGRTQTNGGERHLCHIMTDTLVTQTQGALNPGRWPGKSSQRK